MNMTNIKTNITNDNIPYDVNKTINHTQTNNNQKAEIIELKELTPDIISIPVSKIPSEFVNHSIIDISNYHTLMEMLENTTISKNTSEELANTEYKNREGFNKYLNQIIISTTNKRDRIAKIAFAIAVEYPLLTGKRINYRDNKSTEFGIGQNGIPSDQVSTNCVELVCWCYSQALISCPEEWFTDGVPTISNMKKWAEENNYFHALDNNIKPGDLIYSKRQGSVTNGHVAIYMGRTEDNKIIVVDSVRTTAPQINENETFESRGVHYRTFTEEEYLSNFDDVAYISTNSILNNN